MRDFPVLAGLDFYVETPYYPILVLFLVPKEGNVDFQKILVAIVVFLTSISAQAEQADTVVARISIASQTMQIYLNGALVHEWSVSTARRGYRTPLGTFAPYWLSKSHRSRIYRNAPMPYAVFFKGGYAIHGTREVRAIGRPASHGCVRLPTEHARVFFELVKHHGERDVRIVIERDRKSAA